MNLGFMENWVEERGDFFFFLVKKKIGVKTAQSNEAK